MRKRLTEAQDVQTDLGADRRLRSHLGTCTECECSTRPKPFAAHDCIKDPFALPGHRTALRPRQRLWATSEKRTFAESAVGKPLGWVLRGRQGDSAPGWDLHRLSLPLSLMLYSYTKVWHDHHTRQTNSTPRRRSIRERVLLNSKLGGSRQVDASGKITPIDRRPRHH